MQLTKEQGIALLADLKNARIELKKEYDLLDWATVEPEKDDGKHTDIKRLIDDIDAFEAAIEAKDEVKLGWTIFRLAVHSEDAAKHSKIANNIWTEIGKNIH